MAIVDINWNPTQRELHWFGGLLIVFCGVVAWFVNESTQPFASTFPPVTSPYSVVIAVTGAVVGVTGLLRPELIRYVYVAWMVAVSPIAFVVSNLIVAVVFYLVVAPIGFAMKFSGRDALNLQRRRDVSSYWVKKKMPEEARRYFRQY
jgi:hypothetical protein